MLPLVKYYKDDINTLLDSFFPDYPTNRDYQIKEEEDKFKVAIKMPGVLKEDLQVSVENNILKVEGKSKNWYEESEYKKEFNLGNQIDMDKIFAKLENGILEIILNKSEKSKKKLIEIKLE